MSDAKSDPSSDKPQNPPPPPKLPEGYKATQTVTSVRGSGSPPK